MKRTGLIVFVLFACTAIAMKSGLNTEIGNLEIKASSELPLKSAEDNPENDWIVSFVKTANSNIFCFAQPVYIDISASVPSSYFRNVPVPPPESSLSQS